MNSLFQSTAVRAVLLALILAGAAAVIAPTARGAEAGSRQQAAGSEAVEHVPSLPVACYPLPASTLLADDFSWHEFVKFWQRQSGSLSGVLGTVLLVALAAVLIIMSKGRG